MTDTSFSEQLLGPRRELVPEPPQEPEAGPKFSDQLLSPGGMFGESANPMMEATREGERASNTEFDFPEITEVDIPDLGAGQTMRLSAGLLFAMDDSQREDIIRNNLPGTEFNRDKFGNLFVKIPGVETPVYVNRPGPSPQDVTQMGAMFGPALRFGQAGAALGARAFGGTVGPKVGGALGAGVGEAAFSRVNDAALQGVGSEQPPSTSRALTAGALGAGGELVLSPVVALLSGARRRGMQVFSTEGGQISLTPEARAVIEDAGLDPNMLSQDMVARLNTEVQTAAVPAEAQRAAEAASLPSPVPMTRGNITRNPEDQMFEDLASKGTFGRTVQSIVQGTRDAQQGALRESADQIQGGLSGGQSQVLQRGQGGEIVSQAINEIRDNANRVVNSAYDMARDSGKAGLPVDATQALAFNLEKAAADRLAFAPRTQALIAELRDVAAAAPEGQVLVDTLFNWRRKVTTLASETVDPTDASALKSVRDAFDSQIVDIVEQGLLQGDEASVDLWMTAIARRREFGQVFQAIGRDSPNYLVDLLTEQIPGGAGRVLRFEPDQAANAIFGMTNTGFVNKPQFARQIAQLESVLKRGGREDAWNALREEAFARLVGQAEGPFIGSTNTRSFSGANFAKAIDQAMERNRPAMTALFSGEELALMAQLQRTALATTTVTAGGANFSNTAVAQSKIFRTTLGRLFGRLFGPVMQSASETIPLGNLPNILRAQRATAGAPQPRPGLSPGTGAAVGTVGGPPAGEELQRRF